MSAQNNEMDHRTGRPDILEELPGKLDRLRRLLGSGWNKSTAALPDAKRALAALHLGPVLNAAPRNRSADATSQNVWDVARLRNMIANELAGTDVILVSNREPYVHSYEGDDVRCQVPAGGLVSALQPIASGCGGTWIAHGSGTADRDTVDEHDRIQVPPSDPDYTLRRVWLTPEEQKGYYLGFANESLWPLCHNAFVRPIFRSQDWEHYRAVNARFADAVAQEARGDAPLVIVQDYHFALLPRMIRERLPNATILTFWHIPWPNAEVFGICPYATEILDGLLGSDIIGFQVPLFRINFMECIDRNLESRINHEDWSVRYGGKNSWVRTYPISIAWPAPSSRGRAAVIDPRQAMGMKPGAKLILSVGRMDYTKGIPELMSAFEELLLSQPEWLGKAHLYIVAAPSRGEVASYRALHDHCLKRSAEINARFGSDDYKPLLFVDRHVNRDGLRELYSDADICVVPSLHDGMNLVAKEFVAEKADEEGVLILSRFAGATQELPEALSVNPFDITRLAATLKVALDMPVAEQRERMRRMRETVHSNNIFRWAGRIVEDALRFRSRNRLLKKGRSAKDRARRDANSEQVATPIQTNQRRNDA